LVSQTVPKKRTHVAAVKCAKRTQFPGGAGRDEGQMRQTEPNLGRMGHLGNGAPERGQSCDIASTPHFGKQSQFGGKWLKEKRLW
jgi:hypothetical protein